MNEAKPFLFVVGCGRSGTTLLRTVLNAHPDLAVTHEALFVPHFARRRERYERPQGFDITALAEDLSGHRGFAGMEIATNDLHSALRAADVASYPEAVRAIFDLYAHQHGSSRYGDKMPGYVLRMPQLAELFPESRFVHIIRDGRDVGLSTMAIEDRQDVPVWMAFTWKTRVLAGRRAGRALGVERYYELRYEDLVDEPSIHLPPLCRFLDLPYDATMLSFRSRPDSVPSKVQANARHSRLAEPISRGPRDWRTHMRADDLARFEAVAGRLLEQLGYERGTDDRRVHDRLSASRSWATWQLRRATVLARRAARRARATDGAPAHR